MKNRLSSIKLRIAAIAVLFSVAASIVMISFAYVSMRRTARQNLLQSTEFNLNLISELMSQDLQELNRLVSSAGNDETIAKYLANPAATSANASRAFERLASLSQSTPSYRYLLRIIQVSNDNERILQTGSGTTAGVPVTRNSIRMLEDLNLDDRIGAWQGIASDPFPNVAPAQILVARSHVYLSENMRRNIVGTQYLMVSMNLIRAPLRNYSLPENGTLCLTVGDKMFSLPDTTAAVSRPVDIRATKDSSMDPDTVIADWVMEDGSKVLTVTCPIASTDLYLTQTIPESAFSGLRFGQLNWQLAELLMMAVALGALLMLVLRRIITRPINTLKRRLEVISQGDFSKDPSVEWNNELGDIGRGINDLAGDIHSLLERRVADEKARQELEYEVLLNQVNPHFLYNTLNSIKWMATIQQASGIAEMTSSLARLLKTVSKGRRSMIPLSEELVLLDDYYTIQKYRYGGSIVVTRQVSPECEAALLPRFTLQPLLENAIFHGIEPKGGVGTILLTAGLQDGHVVICLEDDGVGIPADQLRELLTKDSEKSSGLFRGIGLSNVNSRIRNKFGEDWGLHIESKEGCFTRIILEFPLITEPEQEAAP